MSLTDLPGDARLIDLVPLEYDNLSEPTPWINHAESLLGISISFLILSWLFVSFRLFVRWRIVKALGWDDLFVFLYLIFGTIGTVAFLISIRVGTGQHFFFLMIKDIRRYLILFYVMNNSINYAFFFTKLSLLFQYLRIFEDDLLLRRIVYWTMGLVVLWAVAFGALAMIPCWPIDSFWNNPMLGKCWAYGSYDENKFVSTFVSFTVVNMVLDMVVLAIPARLWFTRKMTLKMRVGLVALMFMGVTINFLGAWRLATIIKTKAGRYPTFDPTWYTPTSLILGVLEVHVSSICASVPIFWPVIAPYFGAIFVTQEISVREEYRDTEGARDFAVDDEDDVKRPNSSVGSETELREIDRNRRPSARHYQDEFIMRQVDPLREGQVLSSVQGGAVSEKKRKWQRV